MNLDEIKSRINPTYADTIGTESYERKWLVGEIESLRKQLEFNKREHIKMQEYNVQLECAVTSLRQRVAELEQIAAGRL